MAELGHPTSQDLEIPISGSRDPKIKNVLYVLTQQPPFFVTYSYKFIPSNRSTTSAYSLLTCGALPQRPTCYQYDSWCQSVRSGTRLSNPGVGNWSSSRILSPRFPVFVWDTHDGNLEYNLFKKMLSEIIQHCSYLSILLKMIFLNSVCGAKFRWAQARTSAQRSYVGWQITDGIVDLLVRHNPSKRLRSSDGKFLVIPSARTTHYGERRFSYAAPVAWNNLPREIRAISISLSQFKKSLKIHLFNITVAT